MPTKRPSRSKPSKNPPGVEHLSPIEFKRQMLRQALEDLGRARDAQSFTAITNLTKHCNALRDEIAGHETEEKKASADPLEGKDAEELIAEQIAAFEDPEFPAHLLEPIVEALARRLGPSAMERICRPTLRVIDGG